MSTGTRIALTTTLALLAFAALAVRATAGEAPQEIELSSVAFDGQWWTRTDRIVVESPLQSELLVERIRQLNPAAPLTETVGDWRHTAVMRAGSRLPEMLAGLGLLPGTGLER